MMQKRILQSIALTGLIVLSACSSSSPPATPSLPPVAPPGYDMSQIQSAVQTLSQQVATTQTYCVQTFQSAVTSTAQNITLPPTGINYNVTGVSSQPPIPPQPGETQCFKNAQDALAQYSTVVPMYGQYVQQLNAWWYAQMAQMMSQMASNQTLSQSTAGSIAIPIVNRFASGLQPNLAAQFNAAVTPYVTGTSTVASSGSTSVAPVVSTGTVASTQSGTTPINLTGTTGSTSQPLLGPLSAFAKTGSSSSATASTTQATSGSRGVYNDYAPGMGNFAAVH